MGYGDIGAAYTPAPCDKNFMVSYSGIEKTFGIKKVPRYSRTVYAIAHEVGHNLGASNTNDCVWGDNGDQAIDCCEPDGDNCNGSCNAVPYLPSGGTIMS